jgi:hypothetical protein
MPIPENCRLLHGPYLHPPLRRGDRTACLARDCDVVVTGTSTGRIPWPRCRAFGRSCGWAIGELWRLLSKWYSL